MMCLECGKQFNPKELDEYQRCRGCVIEADRELEDLRSMLK